MKKPARKRAKPPRPRPEDWAWSRAGLELKVCPVSMRTDHALVLRDKFYQIVVEQGAAALCEETGRKIAWMLNEAMNRTGEQMAGALGTLHKGASAQSFDDVITAMLAHPNGKRVRCKPGDPCRTCRET